MNVLRKDDNRTLEEWLDSPADIVGYSVALATIAVFVLLAFIVAA